MIINWLKIALRQFKKNKLFTFLNFFGLTLGFLCCSLMILYGIDEWSYEKWNPNEDVYLVENLWEKDNEYLNTAPVPLGFTAKETIPEVDKKLFVRSWGFSALVEANGKNQFLDGFFATEKDFFDLFPFKTIAGNCDKALEDYNRIALSKEMAMKIFGSTQVIGKTISMHDNQFVVEGVYEKTEKTAIKPMAVLKSSQFEKENIPDFWGSYSHHLFLKLKPGTNPRQVEKKLTDIMYQYNNERWAKEEGVSQKEYDERQGVTKVFLTPLKEMRLNGLDKDGIFNSMGNKPLFIIMSVLALVILLLAIFNTINLSIALGAQRGKEVGVRKTLGAGKWKIYLQISLEIFLLTLASVLFAMLLLELILPHFENYTFKELSLYQPTFYVIFGLLILITIALSSVIPGLYIANYQPIKVLKGNFSRSSSGIWLRNGILVFQFAISAFFIIAAISVQLQVNYMMNKDLGFKGDQVLSIYIKGDHEDKSQFYESAKEILAEIPEISMISTSQDTPNGMSNSSSNYDLPDNSKSIQSQNIYMDFNFPEIMKIPLVEGRYLDEKYASDSINHLLVNETFVKEMGWKTGVGKIIHPGFTDSIDFEIVGVLKDYHQNGLQQKINPAAYFHYNAQDWFQYNLNNVLLKIDAQNIPATLDKIEKVWKEKIEPSHPYEAQFIDKQFAQSFEKYIRQRNMLFVLMTIVILISVMGLFAMSSYTMQQRLREVAIRKTLGAEDFSLVKILSSRYFQLSVLASILVIPFAYWAIKEWLSQFAYRIDMPIWVFPLGLVILLIITLLVVYFKAKAATKVDLVKYLKYE